MHAAIGQVTTRRSLNCIRLDDASGAKKLLESWSLLDRSSSPMETVVPRSLGHNAFQRSFKEAEQLCLDVFEKRVLFCLGFLARPQCLRTAVLLVSVAPAVW